MNKYKKINEEDVIKLFLQTEFDPMTMDKPCISIGNIADLLKTSYYQVQKIIRSLRDKGIVEWHQEYAYVRYSYEYDEGDSFWVRGYRLIVSKVEKMDIYTETRKKCDDQWKEYVKCCQ